MSRQRFKERTFLSKGREFVTTEKEFQNILACGSASLLHFLQKREREDPRREQDPGTVLGKPARSFKHLNTVA